MKRRHFTFSRHWCMVFCAVLLFGITSSCEKGDMGPEGPQGIQGERGAAGRAADIDWSRISYADAKQMLGLKD